MIPLQYWLQILWFKLLKLWKLAPDDAFYEELPRLQSSSKIYFSMKLTSPVASGCVFLLARHEVLPVLG